MKYWIIFISLIFVDFKTEAQYTKLTLPEGHQDRLISATFINDDKKVITAAFDNTVKIWSADRGTFISEINDLRGPLWSVTVSKDQKKILTEVEGGIFQVWSADSLKEICCLKNNREGYKEHSKVLEPVFSEKGDKILLITLANGVQICSSKDGALLAECKGIKGDIADVVLSPDGTRIVVVTRKFEASVWAAGTGKKLYDLDKLVGPVYQVVFSLDGRMIFVNGGSAINIVLAENGHYLNHLEYIPCDVLHISLSNDGKQLLASYGDHLIRIWSVFTGLLNGEVGSGLLLLYKVTLSNDGKAILAVGADEKFEVLSAETGDLITEGETGGYLQSPVFSKDGTKMIITEDDSVRIVSVESGNVLVSFQGQVAGIRDAVLSFDEKKMATTSNDYRQDICIWSTETGELLTKLKKERCFEYVYIERDIIFSPDNKMILGQSDSLLLVWNVETGRLIACPIHNKRILKCSFSADSKTILIFCVDNSVWLWSIGGTLLLNYMSYWYNDFTFVTPDSKYLIADSTNKVIKIFSIDDGCLVHTLTFDKNISRLSVSPNGESLLIIYSDGKFAVWSMKARTFVSRFKHRKIIYANFTPDNKKIITISANGISQIWSIDCNKPLCILRHSFKVTDLRFSPDGKRVMFIGESGFELWSLERFNRLFVRKIEKTSLSDISFINEGKEILVKSFTSIRFDGKAGGYVLNVEDGRLLRELYFYKGSIFCTNIEGGKYLLVNNSHSTTMIKLPEGQQICTFNYIGQMEFLTQLPSGYYRCTRNASRLLSFVNDKLDAIPFEQLDIRYNRPDIVMQQLGSKDTAFIYACSQAYYKRINMLGMDTGRFSEKYSIPICDITNREFISDQQKNKTLQLHIKSFDSSCSLDRINVWINNVPIYGSKGISIRWRNSNSLDTIINLELSNGGNKIEASVLNVNGIESYRMPLFVKYFHTGTNEHTGNSRFGKQPGQCYLRYGSLVFAGRQK